MSAWVLTWVGWVALLLVTSYSVVVVEALAVLDRSVVRPESTLTTRLSLSGRSGHTVCSGDWSAVVCSSDLPPPVAEKKLVPAGIGSLRTTPRASDGPPLWTPSV